MVGDSTAKPFSEEEQRVLANVDMLMEINGLLLFL